MTPGAIVVIDDYAFFNHEKQYDNRPGAID
jgi:hypothetical protein